MPQGRAFGRQGSPAPQAAPDTGGHRLMCRLGFFRSRRAPPPLPLPKVAAAVRTADWNCRYGAGPLPTSLPCLSERKEAGPPLESFTLSSFRLSHLSPGSAGSAALARALSSPCPSPITMPAVFPQLPRHGAPPHPPPSCASSLPHSMAGGGQATCPRPPAAAEPTQGAGRMSPESWSTGPRGESQVPLGLFLPQRPKPAEGIPAGVGVRSRAHQL